MKRQKNCFSIPRLGYKYSDGAEQKMVKDLAKLSSTLAAYIYKMATGSSGSVDQFDADRLTLNPCFIDHCQLKKPATAHIHANPVIRVSPVLR